MRHAEFQDHANNYFNWRTGFKQWRNPVARVDGGFEVPGQGHIFLAALVCRRSNDVLHPRLSVLTAPEQNEANDFLRREMGGRERVLYTPESGLVVSPGVPLLLAPHEVGEPTDILLSLSNPEISSKAGEWVVEASVQLFESGHI
jgi:hypothetical protein